MDFENSSFLYSLFSHLTITVSVAHVCEEEVQILYFADSIDKDKNFGLWHN